MQTLDLKAYLMKQFKKRGLGCFNIVKTIPCRRYLSILYFAKLVKTMWVRMALKWYN